MPPSSKRQKREEYRKTHKEGPTALPKKKFYRQRAHANPFSDHQLTYPIRPSLMDWSPHFPAFIDISTSPADAIDEEEKPIPRLIKEVAIADIGCGFGGLLVALSPLLPEELILGLEIRTQVTEYVHDRITALRSQHAPSLSKQDSPPLNFPTTAPQHTTYPPFQNISALRANTMKFLPNFFHRSQLRLLFLCFPDPHFKARKHKQRIVSGTLCAEYAYVLRPGGYVYTITDVEELGIWMKERFAEFGTEGGGGGGDGKGFFERVGVPEEGREAEWADEEGEKKEVAMLVRAIREETEEGKKVTRNGGKKFVSVWRRRGDPAWPDETGG